MYVACGWGGGKRSAPPPILHPHLTRYSDISACAHTLPARAMSLAFVSSARCAARACRATSFIKATVSGGATYFGAFLGIASVVSIGLNTALTINHSTRASAARATVLASRSVR